MALGAAGRRSSIADRGLGIGSFRSARSDESKKSSDIQPHSHSHSLHSSANPHEIDLLTVLGKSDHHHHHHQSSLDESADLPQIHLLTSPPTVILSERSRTATTATTTALPNLVMDPASSIKQMELLLEQVDEPLKRSFQNIHNGYLENNLERFLKAREGNLAKANKMLLDCLNWRVSNDIDSILSKPIEPKELYDSIRESQLIGMSGFDKEGRPVFAIGVGLSGYDKAAIDKYVQSHIQINEYRDRVVLPEASKQMGRYVGSCLKILDMTGLKLSALNRIKILTVISTIDDLNYPEKTDTYYIVNAPYVFTACWKAVKPLLQERTKKKIQVLQGSGREELLKVMDASVIPDFCRPAKEGSGSSRGKTTPIEPSISYFSPSHPFHVKLWEHLKQQSQMRKCLGPAPTLSFHVKVSEKASEESEEVVQAIEATLEHLSLDEDGNVGSSHRHSQGGVSSSATDEEGSPNNKCSGDSR